MNRKTKHVGNSNLYIGLPYHKRKSFQRDSHGFEPISEYFKDIDRDSSPETDVEELIRQEKAKRKAAEMEDMAKKKAVEEEKVKKKAVEEEKVKKKAVEEEKKVHQRPLIVFNDSSDTDSDVDSSEQLALLRRLIGLAGTKKVVPAQGKGEALGRRNNAKELEGSEREDVPVKEPKDVTGAEVQMEDHQGPLENDQRVESNQEKDGSGEKVESGNAAVTVMFRGDQEKGTHPPQSRYLWHNRSTYVRGVAEGNGDSCVTQNIEQRRPRGRPPEQDESDRALEKTHQSQRKDTSIVFTDVSEGDQEKDTQRAQDADFRHRKSTHARGVAEENGDSHNAQNIEQKRPRGRPPKKTVQGEGDGALEKSHQSQRRDTSIVDVAVTDVSEGDQEEDTQRPQNRDLRHRKSTHVIEIAEENGDSHNAQNIEQKRPRGRPPKKTVLGEGDGALEKSHQSQRRDTSIVDAAVTDVSEGNQEEDTERPQNRDLQHRKSTHVIEIAEENGDSHNAQNIEQKRPRGRPPKNTVQGEADGALEKTHQSQRRDTSIVGAAVTDVSEGDQEEDTERPQDRDLRHRRSTHARGVAEENSESHNVEQKRPRGRPPKKTVQDEGDEALEKTHQSQRKDTSIVGAAVTDVSEGDQEEDTERPQDRDLRHRRSTHARGVAEENSESHNVEQKRPRGRPPKKTVQDEGDEALEKTHQSQRKDTSIVDAAVTDASEGDQEEDTERPQDRDLRYRRSTHARGVAEENGESHSAQNIVQKRPRGRPPKKTVQDEGDEALEKAHQSQRKDTSIVYAAVTDASEGDQEEDTERPQDRDLRHRRSTHAGGVAEENGESHSAQNIVQKRPRGRPPKKTVQDEGDEVLEKTHQSQRKDTSIVDAAVTDASEGDQEEDTERPQDRDLRYRRSTHARGVAEENGESHSAQNIVQKRPRGRPPEKTVQDEGDEALEKTHQSQRKDTSIVDAGVTDVSEGDQEEDTQRPQNKDFRHRKSTHVTEVVEKNGDSHNAQNIVQKRPRGRPPKKTVQDEGDEALEKTHQSQRRDASIVDAAVTDASEGDQEEDTQGPQNRDLRHRKSTHVTEVAEENSESHNVEQKRPRGRPPKKTVQDEGDGALEKRRSRRSVPSGSPGKWFVPEDVSALGRRSRNKAKELEGSEREEVMEEDVPVKERKDVPGAEVQMEDDQGQLENDQEEESNEEKGASGEELENGDKQGETIVRRLFQSPGGESQTLEKTKRQLPSQNVRSGAKGPEQTNTQSPPPSGRKRKRRSVIPAGLKRLKKAGAVEVIDKDLLDTTTVGGKRYHRVPIKPKQNFTPGVRRTHRTRVPRLEPDEILEYDHWFDPATLTGSSVTGVLVPAESTPKPRRKDATSRKQLTDDAYPPVPIHDDDGNVVDKQRVVFTPASAEKLNSVGQPEEESPDGVRIAKYFTGGSTSNGRITFDGLAEKSKCKASRYELFFYVVKGRVLVTINSVQFTLHPDLQIHIPQGSLYSVRNLLPSVSELYYYISRVVGNDASTVSE